MPSPLKFPLPIKPLNATNSWVIQRARELISSDASAIEQWLNDVTKDEDNDNTKKDKNNNNKNRHENNANTSLTGNHGSTKCGHPAGNLEDYDPDYTLLSLKTIMRVLEAAAKMEDGDNDGVVSVPEHRDDVSSSSSLASSGYGGYLPSDSLEEEPLLDQCRSLDLRDTNPRLMIDEKPVTDTDENSEVAGFVPRF
ncbi:hypothetical protein FHL15_007952 [Xylaria flabelliformis]|uniref:Uncharacterized protein n=1 Tax=Xylaria flabelliformis TaxID=2512241 RepID=A0A553HT95_9PEZI|nr:hypothetical protein FHL15_007952 [Xylaria flabelliformis]